MGLRTKWLCIFSLLSLTAFVPATFGQDAVPDDIGARTFQISVGKEHGTGFAIDHNGKIYVITAKHMIAGMPPNNIAVDWKLNGQWTHLQIDKVLYPASGDVDIAILKTSYDAPKTFVVEPITQSEGPLMGQQLWFLGYPFFEGLGSHFVIGSSGKLDRPFIKRGTMSAVDARDPNASVLYIDGFNNRGFSGGPIVYWDYSKHEYKILGVVSGYRNDAAITIINGQQVDTNLLVNSGILVGYSILGAMDAIDKDDFQPAK